MCKYRKIRGANVVQKGKRKIANPEFQGFAILLGTQSRDRTGTDCSTGV